jgi:hypothetical protein
MWLTGWKYRKKITIQGSSGAGTNYQVLLKVGESSGATGADFHLEGLADAFPSGNNQSGDLRFTSSDGSTLLDFWVEKVTGTSPNRVAHIWVEVLENLGTSKDIYCYFGGGASAPNVSNGDNTFLFFDDFDDGTNYSDKWQIIRGSAGTEVVQQNGQLILDGNGSTIGGITVRTVNQLSLPNNVAVEALVYSYDWDEILSIFLSATNDINTGNQHGFDDGYDFGLWGWSGTKHAVRVWVNGTDTRLQWPSAQAASNNTFYRFVGIRNGNNLNGYINNNLVLSATDSTYTSGWLRIMLMVWDGAKWGFDWIFVRKYVSPEPAFLSAGPLEKVEVGFVSIQSTIFGKDNKINREQNNLVLIQSSVLGKDGWLYKEKERLINIQSSIFETTKRERPKQLIKSLKTESPQTKIENLP